MCEVAWSWFRELYYSRIACKKHVAVLLRGLRMPVRAALLLLAGLPASVASSQQ